MLKKLTAISISLALSACSYLPATSVPVVSTAALSLGLEQTPRTVEPEQAWWRNYGSDELNGLYIALHHNNLDLAIAQERIAKAKALLQQQYSLGNPSLDFTANKRINNNLDTSQTSRSDGLGFQAAYEVDLWGSRQAGDVIAEAVLANEYYQFQSTQLQLQALLAQQYFNYLSLKNRLDIAVSNLASSERLLALIQIRFEAGSASGIERDQQRNVTFNTRAQLLTLRRQIKTTEHAIAVLLGRETMAFNEGTIAFKDINMPAIQLIQAAGLLQYRPDIQLAESILKRDDAVLYQQKQKRWPTLKLSADLALQDILQLSTGWTNSLIGAVAMPLIDAGNIKHQIDAAEHDVSIAQLSYRNVVLQAIAETLETLDELQFRQQLQTVRAEALTNNERLYDLAKIRYEAGDSDFLNLLDAQQNVFNARDNLIQAKNDNLQATVNVYKAMGVGPEMRIAVVAP